VINKINNWVDQTLEKFSDRKQSCDQFTFEFSGYYPSAFLSDSYFVVIDEIPKPNFPELYQAGLGDFIAMDVAGITYKNTYFIKLFYEDDRILHFHELVHVLQWKFLGAEGFIQRYIKEIQLYGYQSAPLEKMAYNLQNHFNLKGGVIDIPEYVQQSL